MPSRTLTRAQIEAALTELGRRAAESGITLNLVVVGGAAMVLGYSARSMTHDVDAIIPTTEARLVRRLVTEIADEWNWPSDWLNDGAKGYLVGLSQGAVVFSAPGIVVNIPSAAQLLAMKLSAWRDDKDIADAETLLRSLPQTTREQTWPEIQRYVMPGRELKAQYAFETLWEAVHGSD